MLSTIESKLVVGGTDLVRKKGEGRGGNNGREMGVGKRKGGVGKLRLEEEGEWVNSRRRKLGVEGRFCLGLGRKGKKKGGLGNGSGRKRLYTSIDSFAYRMAYLPYAKDYTIVYVYQRKSEVFYAVVISYVDDIYFSENATCLFEMLSLAFHHLLM
ncbi:hypothetical protein Ancab_014999 [Ancistrocladus abbreviatus]